MSRLFALAVVVSAATLACGSSPVEPSGSESAAPPQADQSQAPTVTGMSPTSGPVGTVVTVTGRGFARRNNAATFGQGFIKQLDSADGETITFTVPEGLDLCSPDPSGPCAGAHPRTRAGDYVVSVMRDGKKSNALTFTVTP
jgi:hypothetical protein